MLEKSAKPSAAIVFEIARTFDAPRDLVWKAWSEAERLEKWWGPKGCKLHVAKLEFRPGGFFHYAMTYSTGASMWGRFVYREIAAPERMVWLSSFSNEGCGIARAPFSELLPLEIQTTATFTEHGAATKVALSAVPLGASPDERKFFEDLFPSMEKGYGGTFEQLEEFLTKA